MYGYLKRSDSVWSVKKNKSTDENQPEEAERSLAGYEPTTREKQENDEPMQRSRIENSYGQVNLGVSRSGQMTVAISGRKQRDETPAKEDEKKAEGDRLTKENRGVYAGNRGGSEGALIYRGDISSGYKKRRMMDRIRQALDEEPSELADLQLPFLNVRRDEKRLQALHEQNAGGLAREERETLSPGKKPDEKKPGGKTDASDERKREARREEDQKEQSLAREIEIKKRLRRDMMKNLTAEMERGEPQRKGWLWDLLAFAAGAALGALSDGSEEENGEGGKTEGSGEENAGKEEGGSGEEAAKETAETAARENTEAAADGASGNPVGENAAGVAEKPAGEGGAAVSPGNADAAAKGNGPEAAGKAPENGAAGASEA